MTKVTQKYKFAVIASDTVVLTVRDGQLQVLLIEMQKSPFQGTWAVPGGLVQGDESVDDAANRIFRTKASASRIYMEQLYTFGKVNRDPFGRVVSVAYLGLVPNAGIKIHTTSEYRSIQWFNCKNLPKLAYDHAEIIETAVNRLKSKLSYTNIVYTLLSAEFTLSELQEVYETILNHKLDKRNFRKKLLGLKLIKKINKKKLTGANRPADLYTFVSHSPRLVDIL